MDLDCKKPKPCKPDETPKEIYPPETPEFDLCVGDHTLKWDGSRLRLERGRNTPDGTYTAVTTVNGCIVDYGQADEPTYTPPFCNPNPNSCQTGGAGNSDVLVSANTNNIIKWTTSGLFARTYINAGLGVTVTGTGTQNNPYIISSSTSTTIGEVKTITGINGIVSTTDNLGNATVKLEDVITAGTYKGFEVDSTGRIVGISTAVANGDYNVQAGIGLTQVDDGDTLTIGHPTFDLPETMALGGYIVAVNNSGHITEAERLVTLGAGVYKFGIYEVSIDEYGTIHEITQSSDVVEEAGSFTTRDNKVVTYDDTGRITSVLDVDITDAVGTAPLPIRDAYRFVVDYDPSTTIVKKEVFGSDISVINPNSMSFSLPLPAYVTLVTQIHVHGAVNYGIDSSSNLLVITHNTQTHNLDTLADRIVTVTFRG